MKRSGRILAMAVVGLTIAIFGRETPTLGASDAEFTIVAAQGSTNGELNFDGANE